MSDEWFDTIAEWSPELDAPPEPIPPPAVPKVVPPWEWGGRSGTPDPFLSQGKPEERVPRQMETPAMVIPPKPETPPDPVPPDLRKDQETDKERPTGTPKETVPAERAPLPGDEAGTEVAKEPEQPTGSRWDRARNRVRSAREVTGKVLVPGVSRPTLKRFVYAAVIGWTVGPGTIWAAYDRLLLACGPMLDFMPGYLGAHDGAHAWQLLSGPGRLLRDFLWSAWDTGQHAEAGVVSLAAVATGLVVAGAVRVVPAALTVLGAALTAHLVVTDVPAGWDVVYASGAGACLLYGAVVLLREGVHLAPAKGFVGLVRMVPLACAVSAVLLPGTR